MRVLVPRLVLNPAWSSSPSASMSGPLPSLSASKLGTTATAQTFELGLALDRVGGEVRAGDKFILMTDGVSDVCSDAELAKRLNADEPGKAADDILSLCLTRGAPDNVSFVIVAAS